tara:strand:- start:370 stop:687 length:318 start_codon:yes stop_codon:yes gene_type:complete
MTSIYKDTLPKFIKNVLNLGNTGKVIYLKLNKTMNGNNISGKLSGIRPYGKQYIQFSLETKHQIESFFKINIKDVESYTQINMIIKNLLLNENWKRCGPNNTKIN